MEINLFIGDSMDIVFSTLSELYQRVKPALLSKKQELNGAGYNYIKVEDIWNCLREKKWVKTSNLSLSEVINDILNIDNFMIDDYIKDKMKSIPREADTNDTDDLL
jgi:hypothetical protein